MHLLIVKHGALGDVVRTSYFATPLKRKWGTGLRLSWMTSPASLPLLQFHPAIDDLWTSFDDAEPHAFDCVYSLDDELDALRGVARLRTRQVVGAHFDGREARTYTDDAAEWFDMGLLSRYGKERADELKKLNKKTHGEIHARMFGVERGNAEFFGDPALQDWAADWIGSGAAVVGINSFAGGRWPSKELRQDQLRALVAALLEGRTRFGRDCKIVLTGAGPDQARNRALAAEFGSGRVRVADTDDSVLRLAAVVGRCDHMITSDSLAMHLAIAQAVPTLAFFSPTSAAEIDGFGRLDKIVSTAADYCSYRSDADNSSITAERLLERLQ